MIPGFFGKMPAHGDFVERGLPPEFTRPWDGWLQSCVAVSRELLGAAWLDAYLNAPVWRFVISPGALGAGGWAGVLTPSVDRVGRHFPLTVAAPVPADVLPIQLVVAGERWYEASEQLAREAVQGQGLDAEGLSAALTGLGDPCSTLKGSLLLGTGGDATAASLGARAVSLPFSFGTSPGQGLLAFTHRMTECRFGSDYCAWWSYGSNTVHPNITVTSRLPAPEIYAVFLSEQSMPAGWARLPGYQLDTAVQTTSAPAAESPPVHTPSAADAPGASTDMAQLGDLLGNARDAEDALNVPGAEPGPEPQAPRWSDDDRETDAAPGTAGDGPVDFAEPTPVSADEILAGFGVPAPDADVASGSVASDAVEDPDDITEEQPRRGDGAADDSEGERR
jgi:type VI secretion system protein ImpM